MTAWVFYDRVRADVWDEVHDWAADDVRIVFSSVAPGLVSQDVRMGAGGDINISTGELTGGNVAAGGLATAGRSVGAADPTVLNASNVSITQNAGNPSVRYMYLVNYTTVENRVLAYNDLLSAQDLSLGDVTIDMSNGALSIDGN